MKGLGDLGTSHSILQLGCLGFFPKWVRRRIVIKNDKSLCPNFIKVKTNPLTTFNKVCPAIMLANNRTAKAIGRNKYEIISIGTKINPNKNEVPAGKKKTNHI